MFQLVAKLSRSSAARRVIQLLQLHTLANFGLRHFPIIKRLPGSGVIYRATRLESLPLANEMFQRGNLYDVSLLPENFSTFADLGCNVGYFTCWLAHLAGGRKLRGLMLDANPEAVKEAQWHAGANAMPEVYAVNGIAGEGLPGQSADFFLYASNICSTSHLTDEVKQHLKGKWTRISVPCVEVGDLWRRHFGNARCNLLKIDIEGSEMDFLKAEQSFLKQVDTVLIEWHTWGATLDQITTFMKQCGFVLSRTFDESETMGTALFVPETGSASGARASQ
jgi:FkbM family methyltransferase